MNTFRTAGSAGQKRATAAGSWRPAAALLVCAAVVLTAGCPKSSTSTSEGEKKSSLTADAGDLSLALTSLRQLAEGNDAQPAQRTIFYLNQWISGQAAGAGKWQPDPLLQSVPRALRRTPGLEHPEILPPEVRGDAAFNRLGRLQYNLEAMTLQSALLYARAIGVPDVSERQVEPLLHIPGLDDIAYLQQTLWLHDIASRARREAPPPRLQQWLREMEKSVGLPEAEQLAAAERLFDWVTRNIQLDALPPMPQSPLATAGSGEALLPPERGEPGPGYRQLPFQVLLHGHGDAWERARVFILLCRQAGIDAVMLGFSQEQSATLRPWLPAALIGGQLYLFEPALGLPIPGRQQQGVATLSEVTKNPQLLSQLDVEGLPPYAVGEKELKQGVRAMIDAEPAALSRRMHLLQAAMPARSRLVLALEPSQLDSALRKAGASGVSLWSAPYEAIMFRIGQMQAAEQDPQLAMALRRESIVFSQDRPLIKGRNLHLQGRFETEDQKPGARTLYLQCRKPDREIDALMTNEGFRQAVGLEQTLPEDPAQRSAILEFYTTVAREEKFHATYWLALTYYDAANPKVAIEWLTRTVQTSPPSSWIPGGRYNLGRCYEQLGQNDLARQWFLSDKDSPQRHGNLLRARLLQDAAQP